MQQLAGLAVADLDDMSVHCERDCVTERLGEFAHSSHYPI